MFEHGLFLFNKILKLLELSNCNFNDQHSK